MKRTGSKRDKPRNKRERKDRWAVLIMLVIISAVSLAAWPSIDWGLMSSLGEFSSKALATFVSFMVIPGIFLALGLPKRRGLAIGRPDLGFLVSFGVYLIFGLWIIMYYGARPDYFKIYTIGSSEHITYILLVWIYVTPVDFFVRRVIQLEVMESYGEWPGFYAATVAWILGHIPEFLWLSDLMGAVGSAVFLIVSGVVTGILYMRFRNTLGLMCGHWAINVIISIVTSLRG